MFFDFNTPLSLVFFIIHAFVVIFAFLIFFQLTMAVVKGQFFYRHIKKNATKLVSEVRKKSVIRSHKLIYALNERLKYSFFNQGLPPSFATLSEHLIEALSKLTQNEKQRFNKLIAFIKQSYIVMCIFCISQTIILTYISFTTKQTSLVKTTIDMVIFDIFLLVMIGLIGLCSFIYHRNTYRRTVTTLTVCVKQSISILHSGKRPA
jgi:hypothetical protein